ncbi:universal stress protein [Lyngbya aestuarii]|uniref:universal stress protein n=1 Tax=Lyngbya aestuarii TaxID=118322 RepID=UPI00403DE5C4
MKRILLCTDGSPYSRTGYEYAAWLANHMSASIEVLYVTDLRKSGLTTTGDLSGSIGIDSYKQLLDKLVKLEHEKAKINHQRAKIILQEAGEFLAAQGVGYVKLTHRTGFLVDSFHELEERADLIMLGKRGETASFATEHLGANLERIVRSSHKPCLVTSRTFQPIKRLLLAYDGGNSCQKALEFLVDLPAFKGLEIHLLTVAKHHGEESALENLKMAETKVREAGFEPICQMLSGDPEQVMTSYVEEHDINFLIMGAYGHSRIRHLVIGSTTAQVLRSCHIPILLFR